MNFYSELIELMVEEKLDVEPSENVLLRLHMASEAFVSNSSN